MHKFFIFIFLFTISPCAKASIFGEETLVLVKMLSNQLMELDRLAEAVNVAKENRELMQFINRGVDKTLQQMETVDSIINRAQGLDPSSIKRVSDITNIINDSKDLARDTQEFLQIKINLAESAVEESALQADTTYKMGQEMIGLGSVYAAESKQASPGRASQISAAASSTQMISDGVMLQNMAKQTELLAMNLELQKTIIARDLIAEESQNRYMRNALGRGNTFLGKGL